MSVPSVNISGRSHVLFLKYRLPLYSYIAFIFMLSSFSLVGDVVSRFSFNDKCLHAAEYAMLAVLALRVFLYGSAPFFSRGSFAWALALSGVVAWADEFYQSFVPRRYADRWDWTADVAGALIGVLLWSLRLRRVAS